MIARLVLAICASSLAVASAQAAILTARTSQGEVSGIARAAPVSAFLGIPFAKPPVGALRWRAPVPASPWKGTFKADRFGPSCEQPLPQSAPKGGTSNGPWTPEFDIRGGVSEDCLTLNVWTPAASPHARLPVLVWIYGGGFMVGGTSVPIYDGVPLASRGMIVVTINYRVGLFGFLAHPALTAESEHHASGNYGLLDQIAALKWIRDNIASFGGDAARVTIAGQSAGAASVDHLIATPLARGLFAQAISESGSAMGMPILGKAQAESRGEALARAAGATSLADLRRLSPEQLMAAADKIPHAILEPPFSPIVDGYVFPSAAYIDADTNDTPILTGMTANETTGSQPHVGEATEASVRAELGRAFGDSGGAFAAYYGAGKNDPNGIREAIGRDRGLASLAFWADRRAEISRKPAYLYLWSHAEPGPGASRYRAFHATEIAYVLGNLDKSQRPFAPGDFALSAMAQSYWANFVKTGNPNGAGLPQWNAYSPERRTLLDLDVTPANRPLMTEQGLSLYRQYQKSGGSLGLFYLDTP